MRNYVLYTLLLAIIALLSFAEPWSSQWLSFDRGAIDGGEWWRLFSAHFVHLSTFHMLGNALGVLLVAYVAGGSLNNGLGIVLLLWNVLVVGIGLYFYADYLQTYVGLSGVLHGLIIVAPFLSPFYSRGIAFGFLLLVVTKIAWEQSPFYDDMAMSGIIGGRVETNAHLLGGIAGLVFLLAYYGARYFYRRYRARL
jgi:rhomboid family GlyGly-CTERM serine protease